MKSTVRFLLLCLSGLLGALLSLTVAAVEPDLKGVTDPTRPPAGVMLKMTGDGSGRGLKSVVSDGTAAAALAAMPAASGASAPAGAASGAEDGQTDRWAVTSIRIDRATGEGVALVGEELVRVGDTVNGMKVLDISSSAVHLKGPDGVRKLVLPDVIEQSRAKPARAAKRGRKEKK